MKMAKDSFGWLKVGLFFRGGRKELVSPTFGITGGSVALLVIWIVKHLLHI
jgi:hypothetical protein